MFIVSCCVHCQTAVLSSVSSSKWTTFYSDPLTDGNDDWATNIGKFDLLVSLLCFMNVLNNNNMVFIITILKLISFLIF